MHIHFFLYRSLNVLFPLSSEILIYGCLVDFSLSYSLCQALVLKFTRCLDVAETHHFDSASPETRGSIYSMPDLSLWLQKPRFSCSSSIQTSLNQNTHRFQCLLPNIFHFFSSLMKGKCEWVTDTHEDRLVVQRMKGM